MTSPVSVLVFAGKTYIGRAEIRPLQPRMGVYGGRFDPEFTYSTVEPAIRRLMECTMDPSAGEAELRSAFRERDSLQLEVRSDAGFVFHPAAVHIQDATAWNPLAPIELHLLGLPPEEAKAAFGT
ncbi:MAG TPA: hypothetical protein VM754_13450 [Actinomycetota bacterium]|nr:hypothetical protein [Actinomycetota bacterium]